MCSETTMKKLLQFGDVAGVVCSSTQNLKHKIQLSETQPNRIRYLQLKRWKIQKVKTITLAPTHTHTGAHTNRKTDNTHADLGISDLTSNKGWYTVHADSELM